MKKLRSHGLLHPLGHYVSIAFNITLHNETRITTKGFDPIKKPIGKVGRIKINHLTHWICAVNTIAKQNAKY
jgi:hypothetical protein